MSLTPLQKSFYLETGSSAAFSTYHAASGAHAQETAVVLCPPLGWEEVCSYRPRRAWASSLAGAGYPVLRVTLPATGDSAGSVDDPGWCQASVEAVRAAAGWLRITAGSRRVVAIGMGFGGMLAYQAAALGAEIDDLVLWAIQSQGRSLLRQWRVFSRLEAAEFSADGTEPPTRDDGSLEAGGFVLSPETVRDLQALDLVALPLPDAERRHVLLLEQDGMAVEERLLARLRDLGASVIVRPGDGYAQMTAHPQQAVPATAVMEATEHWLTASSRGQAQLPRIQPVPTVAPAVPTAGAALLGEEAGSRWTETPVTIKHRSAELSGVLVQPAQPEAGGLCVLMLNAGAVRRIGPSRMWVEAARRWAAWGVTTLRLDVEGIGDSSGPTAPYANDAALYTDGFLEQIRAAMDHLESENPGCTFILCGLCAGAYWSFHCALNDERVRAALMVNPRVLVWDENLAPARYLRTLFVRRPSLGHIRETITWAIVTQTARWILGFPRRALLRPLSERRRPTPGAELDRHLERLRSAGTRLMLLFSDNEPLHGELTASGRLAAIACWPNVTIERIPVRDHTLRPTWAQVQAHAALDRALERELAAAAVEPAA